MTDDQRDAHQASPSERKEALAKALLQALPREEDLLRLLRGVKVDERLDQLMPPGALADRVDWAIDHLEADGPGLPEMIARACELHPRNPALGEVVHRYWPELYKPPPPKPDPRIQPSDPQHEAEEEFWRTLIAAIRTNKCVPVIGPDVCRGVLPDETAIIKAWDEDYNWRYPFKDRADLTRVSQFVALTHFDPLAPHRDLGERCSKVAPPNFQVAEEPHAVLAALPVSLYLTTNQDEFMRMALESRRIKATCSFPAWNEGLRELEATEARPAQPTDGALVYHLFGHHELPESMVVTEDDYIRYVTHVAANKKAVFPSAVTTALATKFLLFIGYGAFDWSFRILVHTLLQAHSARSLKQFGVAVQLARADVHDDQREQVSRYMTEFLGQIGVRFSVLWRDTREFMRELHTRWESEAGHAPAS